tara:strand:- start:9566 stop:10306 length:741 start_codon:yes stop_codon:yes gene_type:complete
MPVNVDTVYQTVQALANKEQRGYITPQEFNLFANQAQQDIFEQYFYDINAFRAQRPQDYEIGNSVSHIMTKISPWYSIVPLITGGNLPAGAGAQGLNGKLFYEYGSVNTREMVELTGPEELRNLRDSLWHQTGADEVYYFKEGWRKIQAWHNIGNGLEPMVATDYPALISCETVMGRPGLVNWGYVVVNEQATYDPSVSRNFEIHESEQPDLVIKILKLGGISIEDPNLYSAASGEDQINTQQENK